MRISRLHLLIALITLGVAGYAIFLRLNPSLGLLIPSSTPVKEVAPVKATPSAPVAATSTALHTNENTARTIAIIGEAYRPLVRQFGDIPSISAPLKEAKTAFAQHDYAAATTAASAAWSAIKAFREKMRTTPGYYEVQKGDTLWAIAKMHSPIKRGPAWVGIWRANKKIIDDFDHVDAGLFLKIPTQRSQYATPFWKPPVN